MVMEGLRDAVHQAIRSICIYEHEGIESHHPGRFLNAITALRRSYKSGIRHGHELAESRKRLFRGIKAKRPKTSQPGADLKYFPRAHGKVESVSFPLSKIVSRAHHVGG